MLLSSWGFWRVNTARDALQTEAGGLWLHGSKVHPCRLQVPWGQRSPLSLERVCLWDRAQGASHGWQGPKGPSQCTSGDVPLQ